MFRRKSPLAGVEADTLLPLQRAARCLRVWLQEEGRQMPPRQQQRAAALIARYFEHEEDVNDQLILSFLRHYSGFSAVDLDDPRAVRLELKAALDRAVPQTASSAYWRPWVAAVTGVLATATMLMVLHASQQTLTVQQQDTLRAAVARHAQMHGIPTATVWASLKRAHGVTRYQDMRRWDYADALRQLDEGRSVAR